MLVNSQEPIFTLVTLPVPGSEKFTRRGLGLDCVTPDLYFPKWKRSLIAVESIVVSYSEKVANRSSRSFWVHRCFVYLEGFPRLNRL